MRILLVRHGKTRGNLEGRYVGRTDEPLLESERDILLSSDYRKFHPDIVFCSKLLRCRQTAELLFFECGGMPEPVWHMPQLKICAGLEEMDFGEFEYKNFEELDGCPEYQAWIDSNGTLAFPGGESGADFRGRCCRAFTACIQDALRQRAARVAFVVHGGTIMSVMEAYARPKADFYSWQVKNGEGFLAELQASDARRPVLTRQERTPV